MKKTTNEIVKNLKFKKPNVAVTALFNFLAHVLYYRKCKVTVKRSIDLKDYKDKPVIVLSNHSARMDYAFVNFALKGRRMNIVAAENEFHRSHLAPLFKMEHVIPKKEFLSGYDNNKGYNTGFAQREKRLLGVVPLRNEYFNRRATAVRIGNGQDGQALRRARFGNSYSRRLSCQS